MIIITTEIGEMKLTKLTITLIKIVKFIDTNLSKSEIELTYKINV